MTKLIKIPFDASLIGQDGIVVKYRDNTYPYKVIWDKEWDIGISINNKPSSFVHQKNGQWGIHGQTDCDLLMYRESKVMSVEEWATDQMYIIHQEIKGNGNEYRIGYNDGYRTATRQLAAAIKNGEVEI
jgi:hypothetical protein